MSYINHELEAAIDNAGRNTVFAIMHAAGWRSDDRPPLWCWWAAVHEACRERKEQTA